jgi:hypothetical protein
MPICSCFCFRARTPIEIYQAPGEPHQGPAKVPKEPIPVALAVLLPGQVASSSKLPSPLCRSNAAVWGSHDLPVRSPKYKVSELRIEETLVTSSVQDLVSRDSGELNLDAEKGVKEAEFDSLLEDSSKLLGNFSQKSESVKLQVVEGMIYRHLSFLAPHLLNSISSDRKITIKSYRTCQISVLNSEKTSKPTLVNRDLTLGIPLFPSSAKYEVSLVQVAQLLQAFLFLHKELTTDLVANPKINLDIDVLFEDDTSKMYRIAE